MDVGDICTYPHAVIFSNDIVDSVLILSGGGLDFRNVRCSSIREAILQLIAAYYLFDTQYSACYVLALAEKYCITKNSEHTENQTGKKSQKKGKNKPKNKQFQCFLNFFNEFKLFSYRTCYSICFIIGASYVLPYFIILSLIKQRLRNKTESTQINWINKLHFHLPFICSLFI